MLDGPLFFVVEGGMKGVSRKKRDSEALHWKYVDGNVISSMGLTSSVRKVIEKYLT